MNHLQAELASNYKHYVKVAMKRAKCPDMADQAVSLAYLRLEVCTSQPANVAAYVTTTVQQCVLTTKNRRPKIERFFVSLNYLARKDTEVYQYNFDAGVDTELEVDTKRKLDTIKKLAFQIGSQTGEVMAYIINNNAFITETADGLRINKNTAQTLYSRSLKIINAQLGVA